MPLILERTVRPIIINDQQARSLMGRNINDQNTVGLLETMGFDVPFLKSAKTMQLMVGSSKNQIDIDEKGIIIFPLDTV